MSIPKLEYGSEVFLKMKALEQGKRRKMTLSEEEREKADAEIKELVNKENRNFSTISRHSILTKEKDENQRDICRDFQTGWRDQGSAESKRGKNQGTQTEVRA